MRVITHLDLDCFFVSCERIKNPALIGKPVIVGGNATSRGVVSSASYEARGFGVRSAMPAAQAKRLCPQGIFLSPDFDTYSKLSDQVGHFLREVAPVVEQASIDEFYLDLTGCHRIYPEMKKFGGFVKDYLKSELKLPASIAIASNKLVSKIAVEKAKPDGFIQVESGTEAEFLAPLPIRAMPGIGRATEREMQKLGFKTLGQIARADESFLRQHFGVWGLEFKKSALGVDDHPVVSWEDPKGIGRETTFERDADDPEYLLSVLSSFVEECCAELRRYQFQARTVSVKFRLPDFTTFERSKTIPPTHDETEIYKVVEALFAKHWKQRMKLRLIGISVSNLTSSCQSKELFVDFKREKREQIAKQMDQIRAKYGFKSIHLGSSLRVFDKDD
ncbi:MAG: DNA polymerase IV [Candidatus Omnitrophica bacterium]|nr:DNA polymerase IV [Candidatus Omnitrophota bacterium]